MEDSLFVIGPYHLLIVTVVGVDQFTPHMRLRLRRPRELRGMIIDGTVTCLRPVISHIGIESMIPDRPHLALVDTLSPLLHLRHIARW